MFFKLLMFVILVYIITPIIIIRDLRLRGDKTCGCACLNAKFIRKDNEGEVVSGDERSERGAIPGCSDGDWKINEGYFRE